MAEKEFVFPGTFLSTEEEFTPGSNTYADDSGNIYSSTVGVGELDLKGKEARVIKGPKPVKPIEPGTTVIAIVTSVLDSVVLVEIVDAMNGNEQRVIASPFASLRVSSISFGYVKDTESMFRIGDILKAKVIEITPYNLELGTKEQDLGVIKAFCTSCRQPLWLLDSKLKCKNCGNTEERKISNDYLLK